MVRSYVARLERLDWDHVNALFAAMTEEGSRLLREAGADPSKIALKADRGYAARRPGLRNPGALPSTKLGPDNLAAMREAFFASYRERFGRVVEDSPIETMSWRLACLAPGQDIRIKPVAARMPQHRRTTRHARCAVRGTRISILRRL